MRLRLILATAVPSIGAASAGMYALDSLGAPELLSVGVSVAVFWLVAYRVAGLLESIAAHQAARRG